MFESMVSTMFCPGSGSLFGGAQDMAAGIHGGEHAARDAMQLRFEFLFETAQAGIVDAHITQHLRGDLVVGIEALEFFLKVNAL